MKCPNVNSWIVWRWKDKTTSRAWNKSYMKATLSKRTIITLTSYEYSSADSGLHVSLSEIEWKYV